MLKRVLFLAASLALALAAPAAAYEEFHPSTPAEARFAWGQQAYPYYCDVPPPPELRGIRFEQLSAFAQIGIGFATKQQIADYIEKNCGRASSAAAKYVNN